MVAKNHSNRKSEKFFALTWYRLFFLAFPLLLSGCGSVPDASSLNIQQMIVNISKTMPSLLAMFTAGAYILGYIFILRGVYKLKEYGEMRTSMSSQTNLWASIITIGIGTLLIFFVSTYKIGLTTLFGGGWEDTLSYPESGSSSTDILVNSVVTIMQVVGVIAFIRGLLLLNSAGGHNAQPGSVGKGLTFVVGGLLAINLYGTWEVLINTLTGVG